jgi:L-arabinokinase
VGSVFFYISGHGFGHSIRQIEIINALQAMAGDAVPVFVRTSAAPWLFTRSVDRPVVMLPGETDTGVVQIDSLRLDERATIELAAAFYDDLPERAQTEAALLNRHDARLVVADAPPLACAAADAAGVPSVICSNFTWDWIYRDYRRASPVAPLLIARLGEIYAQANQGWRLPMYGGFETVAKIADVPFVARHPSPTTTVGGIRAALRLPPDSKLALVSFGGYGVRQLPLHELDCTSEWQVVMTAREEPTEPLPRGIVIVAEQTIYAHGLRYQDIVRAVDIVISKPGYGIISDCLAAGTALLYTSRGRFAEYDVMVHDMPRVLRCRFIDLSDVLEGRWKEALDALDAVPQPPERPRTNGATVVAGKILDRLGRA